MPGIPSRRQGKVVGYSLALAALLLAVPRHAWAQG
jgi:hypothetical protein